MKDFNRMLEQLSGLSGYEFVFGIVAYTAIAVAIYVAAQIVIYVFSGSVTSTIEYGGYNIYPVKQLVAFEPNVLTEFLAKYGVF